jgi:deoxyribonuclease (pyrimidine dimer)
MGTGHVRFFYNKLQYLLERQLQIVAECSSRGFKITHKNPEILLEGIPDCWKNSWRPSKGDKLTNLARLKKRDKEFYQNFIEFL